MNPNDFEVLSSAQTAVVIGVKPQTFRFWESSGTRDLPPHITVGRRRKYLRSDVLSWLQSRRVTNQTQGATSNA